jgi:hypothetical protein
VLAVTKHHAELPLPLSNESQLCVQLGCQAVSNLTLYEPARHEVVRVSGITVALTVIEKFDTPAMLVKAVKILTNISADPATKGAFVESGALAFLIWALQAYPAETQLMEQVLMTVGNAATHPDGLIAVRDGSGIQAAVYLLATHADPSTGTARSSFEPARASRTSWGSSTTRAPPNQSSPVAHPQR